MGQTHRRSHLALALAGLVLLAVVGSLALSRVAQADVSLGGAATPTPTVTPTPLQPPAAPTLLGFEGNDLVWVDNSDNEDGFRILWSVDGGPPEVLATLPANTTSVSLLTLPPHGLPEVCSVGTYSVVAFNEAGESASGRIAIGVTGCDAYEAPPTPSPTSEPAGFPLTGVGPAGGASANAWLLAIGGLGVALVALGGAIVLWRRSRSAATRAEKA